MSTDLVDIHTHYRPDWWDDAAVGRPADAGSAIDYERLADLRRLADDTAEAGITLRALSAPVELLFGADVPVETAVVNRVNDYLAAAVEAHPAFIGLATVNAYAGGAGAEQARYALGELGLQGIVLDSHRHGLFVGSPQARPTLEVAAEFGVPVFVHPVWAPDQQPLVDAAGRAGSSFGRGFTNGTSVLSAIHSGVLRELPSLRLVFTALGVGSLLFAAEEIAAARTAGEDLEIYFDTLRLDPPTLRYLVDVLGENRVLVGSDWPIRLDGRREPIVAALAAAGFSAETQALITSGNARRLLAGSAVPAGVSV